MTITGYSTALFSSWYFVEELGLLLDIGDGVMSNLLQKSRKIKHAFITHPDRDHLTGLMQFTQLNAREGYPKIYYPKDCGSFPAIANFLSKFDPHTTQCAWLPICENQEVPIKKDVLVKAIRNEHIQRAGNPTKSLSYQVFQIRRKLKAELQGLSGAEIGQLRKEKGADAVTTEVRDYLLAYSGDTPVEYDGRWEGTQTLIHEATFIEKQDIDLHGDRNQHSVLEDVMKMLSETTIEQVILGHFSSRYNAEEIKTKIRTLAKTYQVKIPIYAILPGQTTYNILKTKAVNE